MQETSCNTRKNRVLLFILVPKDARKFIHNANSHTSLDVKRCIVSIAKNKRVCNGEFKNKIEEIFWNFDREREREREKEY
jgi:hypothetical protein